MAEQGGQGQRWEDLLLNPREDVHREIKSWLDLSDGVDQANLAKAMLALANSGGGQIIIGFEEASGSWQPDSSRPHPINHYNQDDVNGIVESYADPQFHCEVLHVGHPETGDQFPIIDVPGDHKVPIRAQRDGSHGRRVSQNEYYIRRPGPESASPQTGREWDELIQRCLAASKDDLLDRIRSILTGVEARPAAETEGPLEELEMWVDEVKAGWRERVGESYTGIGESPYRHGYWTFAYSIEDEFEQPSPADLREILREVQGHESGWPPWAVIGDFVYPRDGAVEAWMIDHDMEDPAHADFWRASPAGQLFLLRGYQEDSMDDVEPGTAFDLVLPIWRVGECLLHASGLSHELCDSEPLLAVDIRWNGLNERYLTSVVNSRSFLPRPRQTHQDTVAVQNTFSMSDVEANLPEVVETLTQPLYQAFDFFDPSAQMIQEELERMQS